MLINQEIKKSYVRLFLLLCIGFLYHSHALSLYGDGGADSVRNSLSKHLKESKNKELRAEQLINQTITYYLYISDFAESFIEIPTSNVSPDSPTIGSTYLAGRSAVYDQDNNKVGTCSASFLCMQNADGIYTDISNYFSVDSGLIVTWFTPTTLINLELDSIINSMVTECMVVASTNVGFNPFYGQTFSLIVSSDDEKIYFEFTRTGTIF